MIDQTASTNANGRVVALGRNILCVTLLLLGFQVIRVFLPPITLYFFDNDFALTVFNNRYSLFISNAIFTCVVYAMMRRNPVAIPISILAFVDPISGGALYLLSTSLLQDNE